MVWFQCEDCGDSLKKPKLPNHFRVCSAYKLSCIDCGQVFGQDTVQGHTQCFTESEKYGPKGQGKSSTGTPAKPNNSSKPKLDIDINVGLSEHPPWYCSLCNTSATSKQTLLLHAEGKKHRAKARALHSLKQQPKETEEPRPKADTLVGNVHVDELPKTVDVKERQPSEAVPVHRSEAENKNLSAKRKHESSNDGGMAKEVANISGDSGNGEVIQFATLETDNTKHKKKRGKCSVLKDVGVAGDTSSKEDGKNKIKWKKLITSVLNSTPDGALKMKKLRKGVLKCLKEFGTKEDENKLIDVLEEKVNSSSKFIVEGKYVRLATRS